MLLNNFSSLRLLIRHKQVSNSGLICNCVDMNHALVTLGDNRLVGNKIIELNLCLENFSYRYNRLVSMANHITLVDSVLTFNVKAQLYIFTRLSIAHTLILTIVYSVNLA